MKRYVIRYITTSDDHTSVWCNARNAQEAEEKIKREYWNVKDIIMVSEE